MTKIRNTKKGMAKKTLSISLAVAMLATSNVPVWAAEDLFTDGEVAVEAFVEAPVVEEIDAPAAEAVYNVSPVIKGLTDGAVVWSDASGVYANFKVSGTDVPANVNFYYAWKVDGKAGTQKAFTANTDVKTDAPVLTAADAGKLLTLYIYAVDTNAGTTPVWSYTSDGIAIKSEDYSDPMDQIKLDWAPVYGDEITLDTIKAHINWGNVETTKDNYTISVAGDLKNVTDEGFTVTIAPNVAGYTGKKVFNVKINPLVLDGTTGHMISEHMVATLKTTSFVYTGNVIRVKAADVELIDKDTKEDLSNYLHADKYGYVSLANADAQTVGVHKLRLNLETPVNGNRNYEIAATTTDPDGYRTVETSNYATVTARDLSTVNVTIKPQAVPVAGQEITLVAANTVFTDKATGAKLNLNPVTTYKIPAEATKKGTYDVTFTPFQNNENVTGSVIGKLVLVGADISSATFSGAEATTDEQYTGEAITKTAKQLGSVMYDGKALDASTYEIKYEDNVDAGKATIIIVGKGDFEGSQAEVNFNIIPAKVTADDITFEDKVEIKDTTNAADYKEAMGIVVKAHNGTTPAKEFTLVEGKDYTVKYEFVEKNIVDDKVKATVTITNDNFKNTTGITEKVVEATITAKSLKAENIKLKETDFTYTGKAVTPAFDVVVDGKIINPALYKYEYTNNINAGTATLTVKGDGKTFGEKEAKVTFTIKPASVDSLAGVIASKKYTGYSLELAESDFNLTLNGEKINVKENFALAYGENVAIGDGTVTLTPKNGNFTGTRTFTFKITAEMLEEGGNFKYYMNGIKVADENSVFTYDGTAHTFDDVVFTYKGSEKLVEGRDYDLVYVDNVYGKKGDDKKQYGAVLAVAKGKYGSTNVYTDAEGNTTANVIAAGLFVIETQTVTESNIFVTNGVYAGGLPVKPEVSVIVRNVKLVEGKDYELVYEMADSDRVNATASKSLEVKIKPINGYRAEKVLTAKWGIDKFDLANAVVTVDGDKVTVKCGRVDVETSEYTVESKDGVVTVTANKDSKNYTGSKSIDVRTEDQKPATPMLVDVKVYGNKATAVLSGESEGAVGYDYVIGTSRDCITTKDYVKVNKNKLTTETAFTYVQQGTYYAYCHAWTRDENGKKVFSDWSNAYPFVVTAITPETPVITSVKANGSTVTVTYTKAANADGYDVVLGSTYGTVADEKRPLQYGELVKKNIKGNTVTATFKNVPAGTYYAGLHAFNRTSEDGKKVFSPWSNIKTIKVK